MIRPHRIKRVYLAARFSRLPELVQHKADLERLGIIVTSRWLLGGHEWTGTADDEIPREHLGRFAREDLDDIDQADTVICFTEPSRSGPTRGGRHVEFGYAYANNHTLITVGGMENVFYALPDVHHYESWEAVLAMLETTHRQGRTIAGVFGYTEDIP